MPDTRQTGVDAFDRWAWAEAYECLAQTSEHQHVDADDLERLAIAAYLVGKDQESARGWERAYLAFLAYDDVSRAVRCGFWLALTLLLRGKTAQSGGWLGRIARLVDEGRVAPAARRYLQLPAGLQAMMSGDAVTAERLFNEVVETASQCGDRDVAALAGLGLGQASIGRGETARGMTLFDEVMLSVTTGEVSPIPAGVVYCGVIETCMGVFDLRRAAEWTEALGGWCEAQPDLVPYRGQCLVHRSQILQVRGDWAGAATAAGRACEWLARPLHPALGLAVYQRAELHRLCGEFDEANQAYRRASQYGLDPMPGLALLRLAEGDLSAATAAICRAVAGCDDPCLRPALLAGQVDIMLTAGDVAAARVGADELSAVARAMATPFLDALSDHAVGATVLCEGNAPAALAGLRRASAAWQELEVPYEAARTRVQMGLACRALGDDESAALEFDAAREAFDRLGARPDLDRLTVLAAPGVSKPAGRLTVREYEVLRLVAAGNSNREIGAQLVLSEHTVARHLQNIFAKLGLSSRSAATAYAYQHGLV